MFNLINLTGSAIQISNIWGIHVDQSGSNIPVELYYNPGGFAGSEETPGDWTFVGSGSGIGQGFGSETLVTFSSGFTLPSFATYGIYITRTDGNILRYTDGTVNYSDGTLQVTYGTGKEYPFSSTFSPRNWNGTVYYNQSAVPEPGCCSAALALFFSFAAANSFFNQQTAASSGGLFPLNFIHSIVLKQDGN